MRTVKGRLYQQAACLLLVCALLWGTSAWAKRLVSGPTYSQYVQQKVAGPLGVDDSIVVVGASEVARGGVPGGWLQIWQQYCDTVYPQYRFRIHNAGYANLSSTVLNFPGYGDYWWQTVVVAKRPTVVIIWIGLNNILVNYGIDHAGYWDMAAYGRDLQQIIDRARQIPTVRQIVLVTPMCAGERWYGYNPQDVSINNLIAVIRQTSVNNGIPVIDLRSMMIDAEYAFNPGNLKFGVLTGDGIHTITDPNRFPFDKRVFYSELGNRLIAGTTIKAFGM